MTDLDGCGPELTAVLSQYEIGSIRSLQSAGGTAGKTWKVETETGAFFLRLRGVRTSSEARLAFDHGLRDHLVAHGVPTAAAVATRGEERWRRQPEGVYELYPFVEGRAFEPDSVEEVAQAGEALARYHQVAAEYAPAVEQERIAQYTTLGFSQATSNRMDDPVLMGENLAATARLASTDGERALVQRCSNRVQQMGDTYAGSAYDRLTGWVIHGDYTPANVLFSAAGRIVGIFDLDWALPGARCRDVADGLYFFGTRPRRLDGASIWSLTQAADFDLDRCRMFLEAYTGVAPLDRAEWEAIPAAFAGRWLSIRLEGMAKVDTADRFRFFARGIEKPLIWLDAHFQELRASVR
jgi:Ser/Thr protein kinase RdoA (MazF antagonist)